MHPIAFNFGPLTVRWYGVMMALGFAAGLWTASRRAVRVGVPAEKIIDLGLWLIVGSLIGARMWYVITFWREEFAGKPFAEIFKIWHGGQIYYGGLIGGSLAFALYARLKKIPLWKGADIMAPSIALGYFFGRFGCLFNGCCFGRVCDLPWAVRFPPGSNAFDKQVSDHVLAPDAARTLPVHPTQIYESLLNLALYGGLVWLFRRKKFDGQVFATYLVSYALLRSFVEIFRGDYPSNQYFLGGQLTPAHIVSIAILLAGLAMLAFLPRPAGRQA